MKQILEPIEVMRSLVKRQTYSVETTYRWVSHHLALPTDDGWILYHTLSGEMLWLTKEEYDRVDTDEDLKTALVQKRFLVPHTFDEKRYADQVNTVVKLLQKEEDAVTTFTIFTTLDCNARCFYCYEKGRPRETMTDAVARDVADYIHRVSRGEKVNLRWFGGEPLLNAQAIKIISSSLQQKGTSFSASMVTNGYLFDSETVEMAKEEWNLHKVQITLDGTEAVYNRTKAYVDAAQNPYQKVLQAIDLLLDAGIQVKVRLNMHRNNVEDLHELVRQLAERFSGRPKFYVYAALLRDSLGSFIGLEQRKALEAFRGLNADLLTWGLRKPGKLMLKAKVDYCMASHNSSVTVLPNGDLGRCEHFSESELFGSIYSDRRDETVISAWKETVDRRDACRSCPYYPRCFLLKKCPYVMNTCTEIDRQLHLDTLTEQIYTTYREKAENEEIGTEPDEQ